jgi:flavin reductase (DIM6/NTAB) family NADH-FMN oxidoreductase RutF
MQASIARNDDLAAGTRRALRRLASAVAIVTCRDAAGRHAMTATAVSAMSMQPPSMIVCVNRANAFHAAIGRAQAFAINILHREQQRISVGCGGSLRGEDRFGVGAWDEARGVPVLVDAQAHIVCARDEQFDYGSHTIFVGRVITVGTSGTVDPLVYVDGRYTGLPGDALPAPLSEIDLLYQFAL